MIGGHVARLAIGVVRAPLMDDGRGNQARDWRAAKEHESKGWAIDAGTGAEDVVNRDGVAIEYTLRGPFDADVLASDRVRLMGGLYTIDGPVARQPGPSPRTAHSIIRLISWEG
ncbi:hypothetical protein A9Z40_03120 [Microbacterium arborescens]|uniref:Head-to-tail stopper n=1 Tax=Microbacterium arborescens TaxID=33883 RepID=A0ABX2WIA2_9MICO|nr:hypothetical protein [Microbacterium arborescens]OAZ40946.1 hypothetical protein A9Z40_03120 [Microbacterium arborescens]